MNRKSVIQGSLVFFAVWFGILSCGDQREPANAELLIPRDTMVVMLAEEHLFQAFAKIRSDRNIFDFDMTEAYEWMLKKHHVSDTSFKYSVYYYAGDPEQFESIYDDVINRLSEMQTEL